MPALEISAAEYDLPHPVGDDPTWNESYYFLWSDKQSELAGFSRIGVRTNYGVCGRPARRLPQGAQVAFAHERRLIAEGGSDLNAGGLSFALEDPMKCWGKFPGTQY